MNKFNVDGNQVERMNGRVDWLTATAKSADARQRFYLEFERIKWMYVDEGHTVEPWSFRGYVGLKIAGMRWATRPDSDIIMLSGNEACLNWLPFAMCCTNVTRVDLAVTVDLKNPEYDLSTRIYEWMCENRDLVKRSVQYTLIRNTNGGQTLYAGSRSSDQYGRLYDKGVEESGDRSQAGLRWRYEVEFKSERALRIVEQLKTYSAENGVEQAIADTVYQWFLARDIDPLWSRNGPPMRMDITATITSDEAKLMWLTKQVRPSVVQLLKHGKLPEVIDALGLDKDNLYVN